MLGLRRQQTLVLLHGWGLSGGIFSPLITKLSDRGYRVFSPDLPGFGSSIVPKVPLMLEDYGKYLREYLKEKRIKNPILIGHSFGGRLCLKYSEMYPKDVRGIILSGTPGFSPIPKNKLFLFMGLAKIGKVLFSLPPLSLFQNSFRNWYYYLIGVKDYFRAQGPMRETFKRVVQEDLTHAMEILSVQCLLVWGEFDLIVPVNIAHRMEHLIPDAKLIILPGADHGVPYKRADEFAAFADRFIQSV
jgi:pimeloyl-ACP methyl ester carboxylesterase